MSSPSFLAVKNPSEADVFQNSQSGVMVRLVM